MSFYNDEIKIKMNEDTYKKEKYILNQNKNPYNNSENINATNVNSSFSIKNKYIENQNMFQNYSNLNTTAKEDSNNFSQININNELMNNNIKINKPNIDEIIKNEMSSALIDSFLQEHQIKSIPTFILYLSDIWKELSRETNPNNNLNSGINLFAFNKYYHLPGLIGQRLFKLLNKSNNGFLSPEEFISGMCTVFCEEINSLLNFIFKFYDFDGDNYITFDDIHAVLSYLPIINCFNDMLDIENEIYSTIGDIFINKKEKIDFNTFSDIIVRKERYELFIPLIGFFYDNKPFNNEEINEFYGEYYGMGKINMNEGNYKIKNVVNVKEFETKEEIKNNKIFKHRDDLGILSYRTKSPEKNNFFENISDKTLKSNKSSIKSIAIFSKFGINLDKDEEKKNYEKYILNSNAFDRMRKNLPLVTGNSNILNIKTLKDDKNKKEDKLKEKTKAKTRLNIMDKFNMKKKRDESLIFNFCKSVIKNSCMTYNDEIDNTTEDYENISLQKSVGIKFDLNSVNNTETPWKNNIINLNKQKIICKSYLYKISKSGKLNKLYYKLYNYDLFYYKDQDSKVHKGMHNLSTYFLELRPIFTNPKNNNVYDTTNIHYNKNKIQCKKTINGIEFYYFLLINIKNEIHYYYTPSIEIYNEWTNALKIILKYKNIYEQYIFRQIIGQGKNCVVFYAYDMVNKREVAIKKINKSGLTLEDLSLIQTEVDTLKVCQHPYIVKLYEIIETYNEINIVLEYCELGNLYYYLSKIKFILTEEQIVNYVHNISKAVYSMHNLGIVHRDLKLSNIALTKKNKKIEIRILDFGLSKILGPNQVCNEGYGTPGYAAPEVISRYYYSFEADIWSIGVIAYFLCIRKLPFDYIREGNNELDMVENTLLDEVKFDRNIMKQYSKYAEKFIRDCMNKNTFERIDITEVLEHEWFQLYFKKEVKKRIVNTHRNEFYENPNIDDLYTYDENVENENSKDVKANYLLYTNINNKYNNI